MAALNYSKWDALELSDDSDIEVHPNVDKRSFIRAKQNQIHQERAHRKIEIETLKYDRIINDGLLTRIDALVTALKAHTSSSTSEGSPDELVFQSLIESAGDPSADKPPTPPAGVHPNQTDRPSFSKMMAALVDQVKTHVDATKPTDRMAGYISEIGEHKAKVLDLQQQLLKRLAELEKLEGSKITSESIHEGFNSSHVSRAGGFIVTPSSSSSTGPELINPTRPSLPHVNSTDSGAEADIEDADPQPSSHTQHTSPHRATPLGTAFSKITPSDYRASLNYISQHPAVLAERETDGLLLLAFDAELASDPNTAKRCVHQALLLQYCRSLGRDGVALFFKRITTPEHNARKVFFDDVADTYKRLAARAREMAANGEAFESGTEGENGGDVEQIQLHAVDPSQTITIRVPDASDTEARGIFESFPPGLQRALESGSLESVNKVLGKMSVEEAEEVVGNLGEGGMLSVEEGIIDATTEEGKEVMREIEREGRMPGGDGEHGVEELSLDGEGGGPGDEVVEEEVLHVEKLAVDEVD